MSEEAMQATGVAEAVPVLKPDEVEKALLEGPVEVEPFAQAWVSARRSPKMMKAVERAVEKIRAKPGAGDMERSVRLGAGLWILGNVREAHQELQGTRVNIAGAFFLAMALQDLGHASEGAEILEKTANRKPQSDVVRQCWVEALLRAGEPEAALKALEGSEDVLGTGARSQTLRGWALDAQGRHEEARNNYRMALDKDPMYADALFRLAYSMDLYGDDEEALDLYKKCVALPNPNVNALVNLGVLYEDRNEYEKAASCYRTVLEMYPNHARAQSFLKDAESSLDEVVDEERERMEDRRWATLQIPITDFELSVRSRNCLSKMNIRTLGDLVQKSEAELLSYKNFGETSLAEIKLILESKNLRLGLNLEELKRGDRRRRLDDLLLKGAEDDLKAKPIAELNLSIRSRKCMDQLDIQTLGDLMAKTERELLACKNFGQTSLLEVKRKLAERGISLTGPEVEDFSEFEDEDDDEDDDE